MISRGKIKTILLSLAFGLGFIHAEAQLRMPSVFSSGMVLQQNAEVRFWGWGVPSEKIRITEDWSKDTILAIANGLAHWETKIKTPAAGGPYTITIAGSNVITLSDVLIGEVWICAGQSNMEWSASRGIIDAKDALSTSSNPNIRFFTVAKNGTNAPQEDVSGHWQSCDARSLNTFSAVGYFFGKKLQNELKVPVGLINITWEGTAAESWLPPDSISSHPDIAAHTYSTRNADYPKWPAGNGVIFNGMVSPLQKFNVSGVVWYQGESNSGFPSTYYRIFKSMVESWRSAFQKNLPFYYVQIAPFKGYGKQDTASLLREQQVMAESIPKTGMVVITDLAGDAAQIHPPYKREVGNRLAAFALADTYSRPVNAYKSPAFERIEVRKDQIHVFFKNAAGGLMARGDTVLEFSIAGNDRKFYPAVAKIKGGVLILKSAQVAQPVAVRFAFSNGALPNLFGKNGLPVGPFRTDRWPLKQ